MTSLKRRLQDRCLDVYEWLDYRPDADFRWLGAIPVALVTGWVLAGPLALGVIAGFAILITGFVALITLTGMLLWIGVNALADVLPTFELSRGRRIAIHLSRFEPSEPLSFPGERGRGEGKVSRTELRNVALDEFCA